MDGAWEAARAKTLEALGVLAEEYQTTIDQTKEELLEAVHNHASMGKFLAHIYIRDADLEMTYLCFRVLQRDMKPFDLKMEGNFIRVSWE